MQSAATDSSMMLYLVIVILGMLVPIQTAANARLRMRVQSVWVATLLSFSVSTLALLAAGLVWLLSGTTRGGCGWAVL